MKFGTYFRAACAAIAGFAAAPLLAQSPSSLGWQPVRTVGPASPIVQVQALAPVPLAPVPPQTNAGLGSHSSIVTGQPIITPTIVNQPVVGAPIVTPPVISAPAYDPYCAPAPVTSGLAAPIYAPGACPTPVMPAGPVCAYPGFYIFGEIFDRDAHFPNTPYALGPGTLVVNGVPEIADGITPISTELNSDWGYRVGAGWRFVGGWDVGAAYESFQTTGSSTAGDATADAVNPFYLIDFLPAIIFGGFPRDNLSPLLPSADAVSETINVDYKIIDFEAGRQFCICETLVLRPFAGVRFATLDHDRTSVYSDFIDLGAGELDTYTIARRTKIDGIGLRAGNYLGWKFGLSGFQVFARGELSLLLADMTVSRTDTFIEDVNAVTPPTNVVSANYSQNYQQVIPIAEIAAGLRYDFERWSISGGYELENWFNVVQDVNFIGVVNRGDIGFSGWFVRAAYNF